MRKPKSIAVNLSACLVFGAMLTITGKAAAQASGGAPPPPQAEAKQASWNPLPPMKWPEVKAPKFLRSGPQSPTGDRKSIKQVAFEQPVRQIKSASRGVARGSRRAWSRTVGWLTPGDRAAEKDKPGFFTRLFGPPQPRGGAATVQDFLAQDRPGRDQR